MEPIVIEVARGRAARGGDAFEVFWNSGTGSVDTQTPLTDRPVGFWGGLAEQAGHILAGHVSSQHLDGIIPDGHLAGRHITDEHLWPSGLLTYSTRPVSFGTYRLAVGMADRFGNRSAELSPIVEHVVNTSPRRAKDLRQTAFEELTRRLTFEFTPSPDL